MTMDDVRDLFDRGFAALGAAGITPAGPAFASYRGDPMGVFDAEIGFPLAEPLRASIEGTPTVQPSTLPAGPALALSHQPAPGLTERVVGAQVRTDLFAPISE
jgi:hypothetical protein